MVKTLSCMISSFKLHQTVWGVPPASFDGQNIKLHEQKRSPWDSTLNRPVKSMKSLSVIEHKNIFVPNQSQALFVLLLWLLIQRSLLKFADKLFAGLFAILVRLLQESFPWSRSTTERRTWKPKIISKFGMFVNQPEKSINREYQTVD